MDLHLKNQVVLVTGGSTGLGCAISSMLAAEGAKVAINYVVNPEVAQSLSEKLTAAHGIETRAVYADVSREEDVLAMYDEIEKTLGPIDALVNNAAYVAQPACVDLSLRDFQKCVEVNLQGMFLCSREIIRRLLARGAKGRIVNVASQAAVRGSMQGKTAYDMTKAGMCGFTRSLAYDVGEHGINVNAILPGFMYTDIIAKEIDANQEAVNRRSLLHRIAHVDEVAQVAVFLCSDRASYMIGASVDVSGGMALH
ncbi:MAG: SDR family oxidoreductase [Planctomycetaceae bacterium]|jgi:3-oxoacyl-[acyl-carrier protein] reductase|nr:SDR family oxidoreductase [Planctomycetaceae bacterium]